MKTSSGWNREPLMTVKQAAEFLGMTPSAVYMAIARRELPVVRLSRRRIRFQPSSLAALIRERQIMPCDPPDRPDME